MKEVAMRTKVKRARNCKCPFCNGYSIDYHSIDVDGGHVDQRAYCHDCKKTWIECYKMFRIEEIE